jgi:hypothetical protein
VQLLAVAAMLAECIDPSLGVPGFATDSAVSG